MWHYSVSIHLFRELNCILITFSGSFFAQILLHDISKWNFFSFFKNIHEFTPVFFLKFLVWPAFHQVKGFTTHIHQQIDQLTRNLDVNFPSFTLLFFLNVRILLPLSLNICLAFGLSILYLCNSHRFNFCIFYSSDLLNFFCLICPAFQLHSLTQIKSMVDISLLSFNCLLVQQLLNHQVFLLLFVKHCLSCRLVNHKLGPSSLSLFTCKVRLFLSLLNLVHCCRVREVLDLTRRDALFFLHAFYCVIHIDVLLNSQLL
jgi:hypothetical protein